LCELSEEDIFERRDTGINYRKQHITGSLGNICELESKHLPGALGWIWAKGGKKVAHDEARALPENRLEKLCF
ncbi:hypothetical protein ACJX0J_007545, partial [Zea mays]